MITRSWSLPPVPGTGTLPPSWRPEWRENGSLVCHPVWSEYLVGVTRAAKTLRLSGAMSVFVVQDEGTTAGAPASLGVGAAARGQPLGGEKGWSQDVHQWPMPEPSRLHSEISVRTPSDGL